MTTTRTLEFNFLRSEILNSNAEVYRHAKAKIVRNLRSVAAEVGLSYHTPENLEKAQLRYADIQEERRVSSEKTRLTKRANKSMKSAVTEEEKNVLQQRLDESIANLGVNDSDVDRHGVEFLYDLVRVTVTVCPPTRTRLDPPNLWPTVKPILDGLTDASWWEDDDFTHVVETSFRYGGRSGVSGQYTFIVAFEEVDNSDHTFVTSTVIRPTGA